MSQDPPRTIPPTLMGIEALRDENRQLRERMAALVDSAAYADAIIATGRAPMAVLDEHLRIRTANRSFCDYFDIAQDEAIGSHLQQVAGNRLQSASFLQFLENVWGVPPASLHDFELVVRSRSGEPRTLLLNARR